MITLIIFFALIFIAFIAMSIIKAPIVFKLRIVNEDLYFTYKAFFKEREIKNKVAGFVKSGSAEFDKKILLDFSEVIDIEEFKTDIIVSTPIIHLTNIGVLFFSYFVPRIYRLPFRQKKKLYFKVTPCYNDWKFQLNINGKIKVSLISIAIILYKIKKSLNDKKSKEVNV